MEFEKKVLDILSPYLMDDELASFYSGSLFIETSLNRGRLMRDILVENIGGKILLEKCGNECAFDFV
jgi:hypothetical protein